MIIYNKNNSVILDIPVDDDSYRYRSIMQTKKVELHYSLPGHVELPVGSYIEFQGERYTLWYPENFQKQGTRNFEYKVTFGGNEEILKMYKYKLLSEKPYKLKFPLTAKPRMFIQLLVDNLNLYDKGWSVGTVIEATEKLVSINHENCWSVLGRLAQEFNTEYEITGKTIHFGKVEKFKDSPVPLSYGKGNGFVPGVGRANQGDNLPVEILYVQGGERNIDYSTYKSPTLLLPKSQELEYEGSKYKTDADGMYVTRADKELASYNEDSYDASNFYPSRVGSISKVDTEPGKDTEGKEVTFYNIYDSSIPEDLNFANCLIAGQTMTVIFQSGRLAGREFDVKYIHDGRKFELVSAEQDGMMMPNASLYPEVGDTYAVFNITLPAAYICDNVSKTGASWDMFREAVRYLREHEEQQFTFSGELDGIYAKKNWLAIGGKLVPGGYVDFSDTQFQTDGIRIRITGVTDYINDPHRPKLELSNTPVPGFLQDDLGKLEGEEVKNEQKHKEALSFTKRRWRDAVEALSLLEAAISGFSSAINPITIQTMAMLVGDESLQFRFVNSKTSPSEIIPDFKYNQQTKVFTIPVTILQHMTLGVTKLSSSHTASEYKYWNMSAYTSPSLDSPEALYLYSKCSKSGTTGTFILSKTPYKMDPGDGYYYFLTGALSSEFEAERSFVTVYGFTEILPGRITVGLIVSPDGQTYFNVAQGEIGGKIVFKAGSSGYNNIIDKPDLNNWAYSIINDANQQTTLDVGAAKEALAKNLGYSSYAAMVMSAASGESILDGGYLRTNLIDAEAIVTKTLVTKWITAAYIEAMDITTGRLTVTTGAKIADFKVKEGSLKYVGTAFSNVAKLYIGDVDSGNPDTGNARITAFGVNVNSTIAGSTSQTTDINNMIIDNKSSGNKKTTFVVKTVGGAKNTAIAAYGNVTVNGNVTGMGIPLFDTMPSTYTGFDHNCCILGSGSFSLPTGESMKDWFGTGSNWWTKYGTGESGGVDAQDYDLYVCAAYWNTGNTRINGNSGGNSDYSGISGTPLYGIGVVRSGQGYVELKPGQCAHFKKVRRAWYCLGVG